MSKQLHTKNKEDGPRTFIHKPAACYAMKFSPVPCDADDEIAAHCNMFNSKNRGYDKFVEIVAKRLSDLVDGRKNQNID
jgi:hypothetical protein